MSAQVYRYRQVMRYGNLYSVLRTAFFVPDLQIAFAHHQRTNEAYT